MLSIQGLLQKGTSDCGRLEKVADALLTVPRFLWLGREVTLQTKNCSTQEEPSEKVGTVESGDQVLQLGRDKEPTRWTGHVGEIAAIILSPLAIPFLAVGLACKKISLLTNAQAKEYHKVVEASVEDAELMEKQEGLRSSIQSRHDQIKDLKGTITVVVGRIDILEKETDKIKKEIDELIKKQEEHTITDEELDQLYNKELKLKYYKKEEESHQLYKTKFEGIIPFHEKEISKMEKELENINTSQKQRHQEVTDIFKTFQKKYYSEKQSK